MKKVLLESLQDGAVIDLFNEELRKVMANIGDINTKPDGVRSIKIELVIKPDKTRRSADTRLTVSSKLAGIKPQESFLFIEKEEDGSLTAYEDMPGPELDLAPKANIFQMAEAAGGPR